MSEADDIVAPLRGLRVVQGRGGIEVAYCTKILVDAGAEVGGRPTHRSVRSASSAVGRPPST